MPADERWRVSPYARVSWRDGRAELVSGTGAALATTDLRLVALLHAFAEPRTAPEAAEIAGGFTPEQAGRTVEALVRAGVLVPAGAVEPAARVPWEPSALAFHRALRAPGFRRSARSGVPAVAPRRSDVTVELDPWRPPPQPSRGLPELLDARRSRRAWAAGPMPRRALSDLLWLAARNRPFPADPADPAEPGEPVPGLHRPYPSGGGMYSLEVYVVLGPDAVTGVPAGRHRYLPEAHALETVPGDWQGVLAAADDAAASGLPPVVLVVTSRYPRVAEKYGRLAYGLVLKEVGGLFQTVYLACEHLGLAACALGGGAPPGPDDLVEPVVGEIMIGLPVRR